MRLVTTPAEAINVLTQSVEKVQLHEQTIITIGSDYKTIWCPRTVHKTVGKLRWSLIKEQSKNFEEIGIYLVGRIQNNQFYD